MIGGLKPYADYEQSGVPWLGKLPTHWQVVRSKRLFTARKDLARSDDPQLSATQAYGVIEQAEFERRSGHRVVKISMHLDKRKHVEKDDFVISMRSFQGGIERAWATGAIRSSYVVLKPGIEVNASYFQYLLKSPGYIRALQATGDFIRDGQDLNFANFVRVDLPIPPKDEQAAIGRFLDWANGRLDRTIRAKRKVIALLMEQRQAVIQQAVTRGVDPKVHLKPSGVRWLGEIPQHWTVQRIKYLLREVDRRSMTGSEPLLSMRMHHGLVPFSEHFSRPPPAATLVGYKVVQPGQFVVNRMQAGNGVIFSSALTGLVSPDYAVFDPIGEANVEFLGELFRSRKVRVKFRSESKGLGTGTSGFMRLYNDRLGAIHIALPPLEEQGAILTALSNSLRGVNVAIARLDREIELLREYRASLVADVVSGQLDVREAAMRLAAEAPSDLEAEPGDDTELTDEEATEV